MEVQKDTKEHEKKAIFPMYVKIDLSFSIICPFHNLFPIHHRTPLNRPQNAKGSVWRAFKVIERSTIQRRPRQSNKVSKKAERGGKTIRLVKTYTRNLMVSL
jgi:hypothetical protein